MRGVCNIAVGAWTRLIAGARLSGSAREMAAVTCRIHVSKRLELWHV
jgi:hypothetical protein